MVVLLSTSRVQWCSWFPRRVMVWVSLVFGRMSLKKEEERMIEDSERERERERETEKRQRKRESWERKRVCVCVTLPLTTPHKTH
ncbi:hypothetical protein D8674_037210 [Pyrus ussuriensis x Pyrus communis]|uniref:Uncharacterized protein n=1 Tax=Pyrus ussuriensis x Pyrus communis TaxID=2448454 RepID=A0A5N5G381_9ROSA|nr:hypothetical protein D8674_037210 [Pyrus ussuriensis x Pyrus communis]